MIPPKKEFEQVKVDDWIPGEIIDVQYDPQHEFKSRKGSDISLGVRVIFALETYKDKKYSRWMYFNYAENSNLYKLFINPLVQGAHPNMSFDMDLLKGFKVKVMYTQNEQYQNLSLVRPQTEKIVWGTPPDLSKKLEDEVPF